MTTQEAYKKLDLAIGLGKDRVELKYNQLKSELNEKIKTTSNGRLKDVFIGRLKEVEEAYTELINYFEPSVLASQRIVVENKYIDSDERKYYFIDGAKREGPFTKSELENYDIKYNTLIWYDGLNDWQEASEINDLNDFFDSTPPPVRERQNAVNNSNSRQVNPETTGSRERVIFDSSKDDNSTSQFSQRKKRQMFSRPFSFNGRIRRTEYALSLIAYSIIWVFVVGAIESSNSNGILSILFIPLIWMLWAQGAKRCHDLGHSGLRQFIPFYILWLIFQEGNLGENQYGETPKI